MNKKYFLASSIPEWLTKLPAGEYSLKEICNIVKDVCLANIFMRLSALNVDRVKKKKSKDRKMIYYYQWKGARYYYLRVCQEKVNKINQQLQRG